MQTVHLFVLQVLCFNTAMTHLRHLSKAAVKASGYCKARMRLPLKVLEALLDASKGTGVFYGLAASMTRVPFASSCSFVHLSMLFSRENRKGDIHHC